MAGMQPAVTLTIAEAAALLDPPMSVHQLRHAIAAIRLQPSGVHRTGQSGRPSARYDAAELMRLHAALTPWLAPRVGD